MRVGIDGRAFQPGFKGHLHRGIGLYAAELLKALHRLGEIEIVLYFDPDHPVEESRIPSGIARVRYPRWRVRTRGYNLFMAQWWVPGAVARAPVDVFHFLAHVDAPARLPTHALITVHDLIPRVMRKLYETKRTLRYRVGMAFERLTLSGSGLILTDSQASRRDLERLMGIDPARVRVAPLGVDARFGPATGAAIAEVRARFHLERPYLLYLGGIDPRKNVARLLEAYSLLRAQLPDAPDLVFAGAIEADRHFPALVAQVARLKLDACFRVLGLVPEEGLPALLSGAEAFVFPSLYEGFGLPPLEAMACGTPVVSSAAGALAEVLGDAALLVDPEDPAALAAALARLLGDRELRETLRQRGLAQAAGFRWEDTARATLAVYREVAARAGRGRG